MSIPVQCPACNAAYQLEESDAGQQVECACGHLLVVPQVGYLGGQVVRFQCPLCSSDYQVESELAGQQVECECGQRILVPSLDQYAANLDCEPPEPGLTSTQIENPSSASATEESTFAPTGPETTADAGESDAAESPGSEDVSDNNEKADSDRAAGKTTTAKSRRKAKAGDSSEGIPPRGRKSGGEKTSLPVLLVGGSVVVLILIFVGVYFANSDPENAPNDSSKIVQQKPEPTPAEIDVLPEPVEAEPKPARKSLAERIQEAQQQNDEDVATASSAQSSDEPIAEMKNGAGSANPYKATNAKQFIALAPSKSGAGPKPAKKPDAQANRKPAAKKETTPGGNKPADIEKEPVVQKATTERILFVPPSRASRSFDHAAQESLRQFAQLSALKRKANKSGAAADMTAWQQQLAATGGLLRVAQRHIDSESDPEKVVRIQLLLAWCYLESHQIYEAAVLSSHLALQTPRDLVLRPATSKPKPDKDEARPAPARGGGNGVGASLINAELKTKPGKSESDVGEQTEIYPKKEAANLALKAMVTAYNQAPTEDREFEYQQIIRIADLIHNVWPEDEKADEIRYFAAQLHSTFSAQQQSAEWFQRVSSKSPNHAHAQLAAGQIFNSLYLTARKEEQTAEPSTGDDSNRNSPADELQKKARYHLEKGVELAAGNESLKENVFLAKFTLAQLSLQESEFDAAIELLSTEPDSLLAAVSDDSDTPRPSTGIRSVAFTTAVLEALAKAHVGKNDVESAIVVLNQLDDVNQTPGSVTAGLYLRCCQILAERIQAEDSDAADQMESLTDAALLLQKLIAASDSMSAASLLNAATTATSLGDSINVPEDAALLYTAAADFYAAALKVAPDEHKSTLRYRMAVVMRPAGRFADAFDVFEGILKEKPNVFDAQFEAARTLQAWGAAEKDASRLNTAINGIPDKPHVWGWRKMASTLQKLMNKPDSDPEYSQRFLEARNAVAECRFHIANCTEDQKERKNELQVAATEIKMLALHLKSVDEADLEQLDATYRRILSELGQPADSLLSEQP